MIDVMACETSALMSCLLIFLTMESPRIENTGFFFDMATPSTDVFEEAPNELNEDPLISLEIIVEAIENIRDTHKRPDDESISLHLAKTGVLSDIISARTRERRRRGRGNGHSTDFRCMMRNLKTRLWLMATCAARESQSVGWVGKNEKSAIFPQLLLFYNGKQHDRLLIEGSKNGSLE